MKAKFNDGVIEKKKSMHIPVRHRKNAK